MLRSSLKLLNLATKRTLLLPQLPKYYNFVNKSAYLFSQAKKNQTHQQQATKEKAEHSENGNKGQEQPEKTQSQKHQSHHHHKQHQDHHVNHAKLNKMTFQELIELKTEEAMKLANHKYEHEVRRLKEIRSEQQKMRESLKMYQKIEQDIRLKQQKLAENLKIYDQQVILTKKRAQKQINESKDYAVTKIAKELLEVADCIANCKKYADQAEKKDQYIEQVVKTQQLLKQILKKYDIEEFDPMNQEYDPNLHEGLLQIPTPPGYKTNNVAVVMRTGYTIKGRLLRSARVGIFS